MRKKSGDTISAQPAPVTDCLQRYLETLERIDQEKQVLKAIEEEAAQIPGVEKRPFKSIARAMHDAHGEIEFKLASLSSFLHTTFMPQSSGNEEIEFD
jgi:hypothetical protein